MNKSPPKPQKGQQFTVVQIKTLSSESSPYSVSSFWLQTNQMKRTYRFKRVTKPKKSIQPDDSIHTSEKSITIGARPKSQSQPQPGILSISNPTLSFNELKILPPDLFQMDALDLVLKILPPDFFQIDALDLAPCLLGKLLRRDDVILRITEFGPGGHAYVYLCYGLHTMLNVVADKEEVGAAVLVRSCEPVCGLETIQQRRGQITEKPVLLTGPGKTMNSLLILNQGKDATVMVSLEFGIGWILAVSSLVCQALGISTEWSNHRLYTPGGLELLDGPEPEKILVGPRVGIQYALPDDVNAPWRFAIAGSPWISAPKKTLTLPSSEI
ncbi:DNA-3-methyladenine glycosylase [Vitis vinifera]|uniref:DNA-3-methyladenine glycosylase II n=1 Tax=Vitis vinifera TaxID=29760 RepID=A0A438HAC1_VITVI|nr:DNA-3-methyladenine glycosylase [Vitis vinifera]